MHLRCWFARKMSQFTHFCGVKFLAWKSGCVKFLTYSMSAPEQIFSSPVCLSLIWYDTTNHSYLDWCCIVKLTLYVSRFFGEGKKYCRHCSGSLFLKKSCLEQQCAKFLQNVWNSNLQNPNWKIVQNDNLQYNLSRSTICKICTKCPGQQFEKSKWKNARNDILQNNLSGSLICKIYKKKCLNTRLANILELWTFLKCKLSITIDDFRIDSMTLIKTSNISDISDISFCEI